MKIIDNLKDGYEILKENNISSYKIDCEILMSQTLKYFKRRSSSKFRKKI